MLRIHEVEQGSDEWFALRRGKWTGSTAIKLLQDKPLPDESHFSTRWTERGKALEDQALVAWYLATQRAYMTVGFVTDDKYPNCGYSPDGISGGVLLEVKCLNGDRHTKLTEGKIPKEYMAQIQFGLMICGLDHAELIAYNPHNRDNVLKVIKVPRDEKIITNIQKKLG